VVKLGRPTISDYTCIADLCCSRDIGLGLCSGFASLEAMPGWEPSSWGYHGDNGKFYSESGQGTTYGDKFGTGDVVGCYITVDKGVVFTKNGTLLGKRSSPTRPYLS
jgi:SPRY domain